MTDHAFVRDEEGWRYNPDAPLTLHPWPIWRRVMAYEALIARDGEVLKVRRPLQRINIEEGVNMLERVQYFIASRLVCRLGEQRVTQVVVDVNTASLEVAQEDYHESGGICYSVVRLTRETLDQLSALLPSDNHRPYSRSEEVLDASRGEGIPQAHMRMHCPSCLLPLATVVADVIRKMDGETYRGWFQCPRCSADLVASAVRTVTITKDEEGRPA